MEKVRINKYLSSLGIASRREIDRLINEGKIVVNGAVVQAGVKVNADDEIFVENRKIEHSKEKKVYFLLNKPVGVISSAKDDRGRKTVIDLIKCKEKIFPVGRLDYNTSGLLILTNDGELFNKVIHPKSEVYKTYYVKTLGEIKDKDISLLRDGILLEDGITLPAFVEVIKREKGKTELLISIREGRNRQVRRMIDAVNSTVIELRRDKLGELNLKNLRMGEYRKLTEKEIKYLYSL